MLLLLKASTLKHTLAKRISREKKHTIGRGARNISIKKLEIYYFKIKIIPSIVFGYVAILLLSYTLPRPAASHTSHPLAYRQISTRTDYSKYSFYSLTVSDKDKDKDTLFYVAYLKQTP